MTAFTDLRPTLKLITGSATRTLRNEIRARPNLTVVPAIVSVTESHNELARAATVTAYEADRRAANVSTNYNATMPKPEWLGIESLVLWAEATAVSEAGFVELVLGGVEKRIANASRVTIARNAAADPAAGGWQRVARADGCAFCLMLASRGMVYTEATADFASHDHCLCSAVAAFKDRLVPVKPFTPSDRNITDADRARARAWIENNRDRLGITPAATAMDAAA